MKLIFVNNIIRIKFNLNNVKTMLQHKNIFYNTWAIQSVAFYD